ncbi:cache domain-containing sensor histidine kinase [Paenibacillus agaridevorans]|uniref:cache domain-containing sensor histidine kinase n=1 Tax=Paenibacillus agaridevorans TaxID=171404 RepID=UPI001BE4B48E|nr:sensor histidine kinase [Paenibacillus agaridevorans]
MSMLLRRFQLMWHTYRKMLLLYLLVLLLPAGCLLYYYFEKSADILERQVTQSMLKSVQQVKINLDYRLAKVQEISDALILNTDLYEILARDPQSGTRFSQVEEEKKLGNMLRSLQGSDILKIKLYVNADKMYAGEHVNFFSLDQAARMPWYDEVVGRNGAVQWIPTHMERYISTPSEARVFSSARIIRDPNAYSRIIGILMLDVAEANLAAILNQAELDVHSHNMYVADATGMIVSHGQPEKLNHPLLPPETFKLIADQPFGIEKITMDTQTYFVIFDTLSEGGWKVVSLLPAGQISRMSNQFNVGFSLVLALSLALLFIVGAFLVFAHLTRGTINRVRDITEQLRVRGAAMIEEGIPHPNGVVIRLEKSVTHMLSTFQHLMEDNYRAKEREKEARLRALQAQINPHFLYNALDTINWMALTKGAHDISRMLNMLAQYFRLTLNKGKDIVPLEDEMNLSKAYLEIQKQRFHNFDYSVEFPVVLSGRSIPKLSIQPIIENAIMHGVHNREGHHGSISVEAEAEGQAFVIRVTDDGIGMTEEQIAQLYASLNASSSSSSYGLYNVWERVRLFTGGAGRLVIESQPGRGTTVSIWFPAEEYERNE